MAHNPTLIVEWVMTYDSSIIKTRYDDDDDDDDDSHGNLTK